MPNNTSSSFCFTTVVNGRSVMQFSVGVILVAISLMQQPPIRSQPKTIKKSSILWPRCPPRWQHYIVVTHTKNSENVNISPLHTVLKLQNHSEYYSIGGSRHPIKVRLRTLIRSLLTICCLSSISSCFSTSSIYVWRKGSVSALKSLRNTPRRKDIKVYICGGYGTVRWMDGWMNQTEPNQKKKKNENANKQEMERRYGEKTIQSFGLICVEVCVEVSVVFYRRRLRVGRRKKSTVIIHHLTVCVVSLILAWARQFTRLSFNNTEVALT